MRGCQYLTALGDKVNELVQFPMKRIAVLGVQLGSIKNLTEEVTCSNRNSTQVELEVDPTLDTVEVCVCVDNLCNTYSSSGTADFNISTFLLPTTVATAHNGQKILAAKIQALLLVVVVKINISMYI